MKHVFIIAALLISTVAFSQNTGLVVGKIMDAEVNNAPLVLANVTLKGTEVNVDTDQTGLFVLENLEAGDYTLVCSFVGYETKELNIHVDAFEPTELKLSLAASTISFEDLALLTSTAEKEDTSLPRG